MINVLIIIIHTDDICLMAPIGTAMQNRFDVCHNFGISNDFY